MRSLPFTTKSAPGQRRSRSRLQELAEGPAAAEYGDRYRKRRLAHSSGQQHVRHRTLTVIPRPSGSENQAQTRDVEGPRLEPIAPHDRR